MGSCAANFSSACTVVAVALVSFSEAPLRSPFCVASLGPRSSHRVSKRPRTWRGGEGVRNDQTSVLIIDVVLLVLALVLLALH